MPDQIKLLCWVQGHPLDHGFLVRINLSNTIADLKEAIQAKKPSFQKIDPASLQLWKSQLSMESINDDHANGIKLEDGQQLKLWRKISFYWKEEPADDILSVILPRPAGTTITPSPSMENKLSDKSEEIFEDQPPAKRRRSGGEKVNEVIPAVFIRLWTTFWGKSATECFVEEGVKIPDSRTLAVPNDETKFTYLKLPGDIKFPCGLQRILVTETYTSFYAELCREDSRWEEVAGKSRSLLSTSHSTVMTGQPGIGKTTCLSFILVRRLQEKKQTVYCNHKKYAFLFTDAGVQKVSCQDDQGIDGFNGPTTNYCALVNIHPGLVEVPEPFHPSPSRLGRVVVASSPNPAHFTAFRECPAMTYTLPTWNWDDLYCASVIVNDRPLLAPHDEKLLEMFTMLRGIPRRCFRALFGEELEVKAIKDAISQIQSIEEFIMAASGPIPFKQLTSHILVRIEPTDAQWGNPHTELLSEYVASLVYDRINLHSMTIRNSIDCLLRTPKARGWGGNLFEKAIHRRFRAGITLHPDAMDDDAPTLDIEINPVESEAGGYFHTLSVRKEARSRKVAITFLNQYLIPLSSTAETIDSVYISQDITVLFQITVSPSHDLNLKGITELTDELPFEAKKRVCIVFVVPDHETTTSSYKRQKIVAPAGMSKDIVGKVVKYHQYVHYASMNGI